MNIMEHKQKGFTPLEIAHSHGQNLVHKKTLEQRKSLTGFTLIELLVVIAVIGMLASIVLVSLGPVRAKARDARRQADIRQISTAMELEFNQQNGTYTVLAFDAGGRLTSTVIGTAINPIPTDPGGGADTVCPVTTAGEMAAGGYCGVANASPNNNKYCVFARLSTSTFFAASETGVKTLSTAPTTLATCK